MDSKCTNMEAEAAITLQTERGYVYIILHDHNTLRTSLSNSLHMNGVYTLTWHVYHVLVYS